MGERVELRLVLREGEVEKFWEGCLEGSVVTTRSGKLGAKGRRSTKDHGDPVKAQKALEKAKKRKVREGFWEEGAPWPPVIEVDEEIDRHDTLCVVTLPKKHQMIPSLIHVCPPHLEKHGVGFGFTYFQGPGRYNLWFKDGLHVGLEHKITPVALEIDEMPDHRIYRYPMECWRPDGEAMLVSTETALYEVDLANAEARLVRDFEDMDGLLDAAPFVYAQDGKSVLWRSDKEVVSCALSNGDVSVWLPGEEEPILDLTRLSNGSIAVLRESSLRIFDKDERKETLKIMIRRGFRVSTMLQGRVVVLMTRDYGESQTLFYGLHGESLHELHRSARTIRDCFDSRGQQFMIESAPGGELDWEAYRVFNVERVWRESIGAPTLVPKTQLTPPSFHDAISDIANDQASLSKLGFVLENGGDLEARAYSDGTTPLGYAAWRGQPYVVKWLLKRGADVNGISRIGEPPLTTAIHRGFTDLIEPLLLAGASPSLPSKAMVEGNEVDVVSPVAAAARWLDATVVLDLLDRGADPNATGEDGRTTLESALLRENVDLAEILVAKGASLNSPRRSALESALAGKCYGFVQRYASQFSDIKKEAGSRQLRSALLSLSVGHPMEEVIDAMLKAGANDTSTEGLYRAVDAEHEGAVRAMLAAGADPNATHFTATNPSLRLHQTLARTSPKRGIVEALLDAGAKLDTIDNRGVTPLRYAISNNTSDEVIHLLLDRGAPLSRGESVWGPLHQAAAKGRVEVVKELLKRGAEINETTGHDLVPLEIAIHDDKDEVALFLIEAGAEIDGGGFTPLMSAAVQDKVAMVERLLELGADPKRKAANPYLSNDNSARSAHEHAESAGSKSVITFLNQRSGGFATVLGATEAGDVEALKGLLSEGADPNQVSGELQRAPLHLAPRVAIIDALVAGGAKVDLADKYRRSPLLTALLRKEDLLARVEALLGHGADPNHRDEELEYSLHFAVRAGQLEVVQALLKAGAKAHHPRSNMQPLHVAAARGELEISRALLKAGAKVDSFAYNIHGGQVTPLHEAADNNQPEVAELLISHGAEVDAHDDDEDNYDEGCWTPIHMAANRGHFEVMCVLLRHDDAGGIYQETASHRYVEDLAEDHPRVLALIEAVQNDQSVDDFLVGE